MTRLTNFYSNDSHEALNHHIDVARSVVSDKRTDYRPGTGPGDYEAHEGRRSEFSRRLGIMLEEKSWRDRNPGGWEREQEQRARIDAMFGIRRRAA